MPYATFCHPGERSDGRVPAAAGVRRSQSRSLASLGMTTPARISISDRAAKLHICPRLIRTDAKMIRLALAPLCISALVGPAAFGQQTQSDDYTRYELLAPSSGKFRIYYEVTATTAGAIEFFDPIRKGSVASDEHVYDRLTGAPLAFDVLGGDVARAGGVRNADSTSQYIRVHL